MPPQEEPNPDQERQREKAADKPEAGHLDSYIRSRGGTQSDTHSQSKLFQTAFADPSFPIDYETVQPQEVVRYVSQTLGPEAALSEGWDDLDETYQRMYSVVVLKQFYEDRYKKLETRLKSANPIAHTAGFNQDEIPSDTTLWREIRGLDEDFI